MTRPITEWVKILEPMTAQEAATSILAALAFYSLSRADWMSDRELLANALTAWAMLAKATPPPNAMTDGRTE